MADSKEEILYQLKIEENRALRSLTNVKEAVGNLDRRTTTYKNTVKEQVRLETQLASIRKQRIQVNKNVEKSVKSLTKAQIQKKNAVGASTSATLELGRVLSDMPYGIRGVANNLQQLASNLFFMSKASDAATGKVVGFGGAISRLLGGLIGPAGILIAFQGVIALFDFLSQGAKDVEKSVSDLKSEFQELSTILADNVNVSIKNYLKLVKQKTDLDAELTKSSERLKEIEEELLGIQYSKERTNNFELLQKLRQEEITLQNEIEAIYKTSADSINDYKKAKDDLTKADEDSLKGLKNTLKDQKERRETLSDTSEKYKELTKAINETQKAIEAIEGKKTKGGNGGTAKISPFKTGKELDLEVKSNEAALLSYSNKIQMQELKNTQAEELLNAKTAKEKDVIKRKFQEKFLRLQLDNELAVLELKKETEKQVLEAKYKTFQEEAKLRFLAYEDSIKKNDKLSKAKKESLIGSARTDTSKLLSDSFEERNKELGQGGTLEEKYKTLFELFNKLKKSRLDALGIGSGEGDQGADENPELNKISVYIESYKTLMSGLTQFLDGEFERQLTSEQNKTNVLNKELNDRLINENLSAEQRKSIQNQIAQNDEDLRVKQEAIKKKQFKQQKAFNIAMAVISTYSAAAKVLDDTKGGSFARIAGMIAVIGSGLAQVAAISRQKYQSSSANTPIRTSTGGGASQRSDPSFNIVGRSNENLLINAIQAQFDKPLKAYVVSRDVTNQQQLDGMIVGQAGT